MMRILLVGYDPETVDFSDPALPPGMTAEKIRAGIGVALRQFAERGWQADVSLIRPDDTAGPTVERQLASTSYDCIVIGAGVRLPPERLALFEAVINAVHKAAPRAGDRLQYSARRQRRCGCPMVAGGFSARRIGEQARFVARRPPRRQQWPRGRVR